jgi:hypothetical protein
MLLKTPDIPLNQMTVWDWKGDLFDIGYVLGDCHFILSHHKERTTKGFESRFNAPVLCTCATFIHTFFISPPNATQSFD